MHAQQLPAPPKVEVIAALGDAIPLRNTLSAEQLQLLAFCAANSLFRYRDLFLGLGMTVSRKYVPTVPCYLGSLTPRLQRSEQFGFQPQHHRQRHHCISIASEHYQLSPLASMATNTRT